MEANESTIRSGTAGDFGEVERLERDIPEAARWNPPAYLEYDFRVAVGGDGLKGFVVARDLGSGEAEILNLVVAPEWRRRGIARALVGELALAYPQALFLEVRESNSSARAFYQSFGFQEVGRRPDYYRDPPEAAVVMRFCSCYCHK